MKLATCTSALFSALAVAASSAASAAALLVSGGILQGATGVNVNGTLYNVTFVDGTCAQTFTGCDQNSDFQFQTKTDALAAGNALLNQVFLDGSLGNFDTNPGLTAGCQGNAGFCYVFIPYAIYQAPQTSVVLVENLASVNGDIVLDSIGIGTENTSDYSFKTYARWGPSPELRDVDPGVPEPSVWATMIVGFGFVAAAMRRRQKTADVTCQPAASTS